MKGKKRQGSTLPMVIVTIVLLVAMLGIMASIVDTGQVQTQRMYSYMKAKYAATSGSQLALGAYFGDEGGKILYNEFGARAESRNRSREPIKSTHTFKDGAKAEIEINGSFEGATSGSENYYITIVSKSYLTGSKSYYEHTVVFKWATSGILSEKGRLVTNE